MRKLRTRNILIRCGLLGCLLGCGPMTELRPMTLEEAKAQAKVWETTPQDIAAAQAFGAQCTYTPETCPRWTEDQRKLINALSPADKATLKEHLANTYLANLESLNEQKRKAIWDAYAQKTPTVPTPTTQAKVIDAFLRSRGSVGSGAYGAS
jgi:hypothetical protein